MLRGDAKHPPVSSRGYFVVYSPPVRTLPSVPFHGRQRARPRKAAPPTSLPYRTAPTLAAFSLNITHAASVRAAMSRMAARTRGSIDASDRAAAF